MLGGDGLIQVFVHGAADEIWGIREKSPDSTSSWSSYFIVSARNAGVIGPPTAVTDADGRIRVLWRAGNVGYHAVQPAGHGMVYNIPGTTQGKIGETPVAVLAMDGRLEVSSSPTPAPCTSASRNRPTATTSPTPPTWAAPWPAGPGQVPRQPRRGRLPRLRQQRLGRSAELRLEPCSSVPPARHAAGGTAVHRHISRSEGRRRTEHIDRVNVLRTYKRHRNSLMSINDSVPERRPKPLANAIPTY
ncbi:hypothetical protein [Streptomyces sp. NPDC003077]|uniref:hypothetical protein n=1 Tax=Streptomyces sp. NPDC003077 TaxID=3154443 RepID=UPI0033A1D869